MSTEKNKCQYCSKETDLPWMYLAMTIPIEEYEERIEKLGRKDWWEKVDWDNPSEEDDQLGFYDQLLNTVGRGYACEGCLEKEDRLMKKYYDRDLK